VVFTQGGAGLMSKLIKIRAYEYAELNDKAKDNFINSKLKEVK